MILLPAPDFDPDAKRFRSVSVAAVDAAKTLQLAVVTNPNIARGLPPVRYLAGKTGRAIFVSSGLQRDHAISEYLLWREIARSLDDRVGPVPGAVGRWSKHIRIEEAALRRPSVRHEWRADRIRINHHFAGKGIGEVEYDESAAVPDSMRESLDVAVQSRAEVWCDGFADTLACPKGCAEATPHLFRLVQFALRIDLGIELNL